MRFQLLRSSEPAGIWLGMAPKSRVLSSLGFPATQEQKVTNAVASFFSPRIRRNRAGCFLFQQHYYFLIEGDKTCSITLARDGVFGITVKRPFLGTGKKRRREGIALWTPWHPPSTAEAHLGQHKETKETQTLPQGALVKSSMPQLCHISKLCLKTAYASR